jgi:hypothetical protein
MSYDENRISDLIDGGLELQKQIIMTKIEQNLIDIANEGQTDKKVFKGEGFTRAFAGRIKDVAELRNPLGLHDLLFEIDKTLEIINPELKPEIEWLNKLIPAIKLFHNEILYANRILGIKDDNSYDVRVFEKVVIQKFFMELHGKTLNPNTVVETDFKTMVELVELGARRFGR